MPVAIVAGLAYVAQAILAIIIILAVVGIGYLITKFGGQIPLVGAWLAGRAYAVIQSVVAKERKFYESMLWAATNVINAIILFISYIPERIWYTAGWTTITIEWIVRTYIPHAIQGVVDLAWRLRQDALNYAASLYHRAIDYVNVEISHAGAYALGLYHRTIDYVNVEISHAGAYALGLYHRAIDYVNVEISHAGAYALGLVRSLAMDIANIQAHILAIMADVALAINAKIAALESKLTALIEQYASIAIHDAIRAVDIAASGALAGIWPILVTDVDTLVTEIPDALSDLRDLVARIPRAIPGDLADALAGLGVMALPMLRYLVECGIPLCRNLSGLSGLLDDLLSDAVDIALVALLGQAARHPSQAARDILDAIGPVVNEAATLTRGITGG